jgi:predicted transglutaminase-like cysteine proteinase
MSTNKIKSRRCYMINTDYSWINSALPTNSIFNDINGTTNVQAPNVFQVLNSFTNQKYTSPDEITSDPMFVNMFLQYPNNTIAKLAGDITKGLSSDDDKVKAIQEWVVRNIDYMEDKEQYGYDELWVPPLMTLKSMKGDCEDGAFLIMSLSLNSGVDPDRLRFYGGEVKAGQGAATGGHGWVAYSRETDDDWVVLDFSYYPDLRPVDEQIPMAKDERYVSQYFMFEVGEIITSSENRVRNPYVNFVYNNQGYMQPNVLLPGTWMSQYA